MQARSVLITDTIVIDGWITTRCMNRGSDGTYARERRHKVRHETHLLGLACPCSDPGLRFVPGFVQGEETSLSATLDELIRLRDELGVENPARELGVRGDGVGFGVP